MRPPGHRTAPWAGHRLRPFRYHGRVVVGRRQRSPMTAAVTVPTGTSNPDPVDGSVDRTDWVAAIPFLVAHLVPLAAFFVVVTWQDWVLCAVLYVSRMFFITAGYHRYFSHRSYRMSRAAQFLMAFGGTTALQKGPLWWASHHRLHHRYHRPRRGRPLSPGRVLVEPRGLDPVDQVQGHRPAARSRTSPPIPSSGWSSARRGSVRGSWPSPASSSGDGAAWSSGSSCPPSCSGTVRSWSIPWPISWAGGASPPRTPAATR